MYPDYLVLISYKDKLTTFNKDLEMVELIGLKDVLNLSINYIIVNNLDIELFSFCDNNYFYNLM